MDENEFLAELSLVNSRLKPSVGDIRDKVWRRVNVAERTAVRREEPEGGSYRWVFKMEVTAALVFIAVAPFAYGAIVSLLREMYWNGSVHALLSAF